MNSTKALRMPSSFAAMNEEEMTYLEGGYRASRTVYIPAGSKRMSKQEYVNTQQAKSTLISIIIGAATTIAGDAFKIPVQYSVAAGVVESIISYLGGNSLSNAEKNSYEGAMF